MAAGFARGQYRRIFMLGTSSLQPCTLHGRQLGHLMTFREHAMKHFLTTLPVLFALTLLTGCPQSKVPDKPLLVPEPKAALNILNNHQSYSFEI